MAATRTRWAAVLEALGISILVALPSLWLPRLVSSDFSSHLYNIWFVHDLQQSPIAGLELSQPSTNILADLLLDTLSDARGIVWNELVVPLLAVLGFFWGAFFWLRRATGQAPRSVAPLLAMLSYGAVFQFGFLNHYLSAALSLWVLGLLWQPSERRVLCSIPLIFLAWMAHPLPLAWAAAVLLFRILNRLTPAGLQGWWVLASLVAVGCIGELFTSLFASRRVWEISGIPEILLEMTGADQVWLYGSKYLALAMALAVFAIVSVFLNAEGSDTKGSVWNDLGLQLWLVHAAAVLAIPAAIQLPGYQHVLAFIPQRISLFGGIALCLALTGRAGKRTFAFSLPFALVFFTFLYMDGAAYNRVQAEVTDLVHTIPDRERVIGPIYDSGARIPALAHVVDRACIGWCYSYANYEPATGQFRVQVTAENPRVARQMAEVQLIEEGQFTVPERLAPMYAVCACEQGTQRFCIRKLTAGQKTCSTTLQITPGWWPF